MPKALVRREDGVPWLALATGALSAGGCEDLVVVLGAMAESALHLVPADSRVVVARSWESGQSASLRAGLAACAGSAASAVIVTLVDLPDLSAEAVRRVGAGAGSGDLRRAAYGGQPGHPVLIGSDHWPALLRSLRGDAGASAYLRMHSAAEIDCTDLGGGDDVDASVSLAAGLRPSRDERTAG
jgi:CTP:molybdopterin cytidylyltransferase MocA